MKKILILVITTALFGIQSFHAQTPLTLEECKQLAVENYPLIKQYGLIELSEAYTLENISKNYLPQFGINAQATYQSDVTKLPFDVSSLPVQPDIPTLSKDQYKATVEASQLLWDGGIISSQRKITKAGSEVDRKQVDVNLHPVREKVNQLFFSILSIDEQLRILALTEENLLSGRKITQSMFDNQMAMQSDLDLIDVELLHIEQKRIEQTNLRKSCLHILSLFTNRELGEDAVLQKPEALIVLPDNISRSELDLFNARVLMLNARKSAVDAKNMPHINLFAQGGYGRPALNMLEDKFKLFAIGGIKLSWNFGNLYTTRNEKQIISSNIDNIAVQRETFLFNTTLQLTQEQSEIQKMKELLDKDDEIIRLRNRVRAASESKYKNGVYQINELIRDINAEGMAHQTKALHEIQYLMNIYNYKHIQGE